VTFDQAALLRRAASALKSAQLLFAAGQFEDAASPSYYAMFSTAQALLVHKGLTFKRHGAVVSAFAEHFTNPGVLPREMHRALIDAQVDRLNADYGGDQPPDRAAVARDIAAAERMIAAARAWLEAQP